MQIKSTLILLALASASALAQSPTASPDFQILDHHKANTVRFDPTVDWRNYKQFRLAPATANACSPKKCLRPNDGLKLTRALDKSLQSTFRKVPVSAGPVLEIRPVITRVWKTDILTNVVSFALIQMPLSYGAASVRFELIDAESGRQVGDIDSARYAAPWNIPPWDVLENFRPLGQTTVLLKNDAKRLRKDLKRLAELAPTQTTISPAAPSAGQ